MFTKAILFFLFAMGFVGCTQDSWPTQSEGQESSTQTECQILFFGANISGGCWVGGVRCGAPSPYVRLNIGNKTIFQTKVCHKTFTPMWNDLAKLARNDVQKAEIILMSGNQWISSWKMKPNWTSGNDMIVASQSSQYSTQLSLAIVCQSERPIP